MLLLLLACADDPSTDGPPADTGPTSSCAGDPTPTILSPASGDVFDIGETVSLHGDAPDAVGDAHFLWGIDSDTIALGQVATWTPEASGDVVLTLQVEDDCGTAQTSVNLRVREPASE
jgi:hypothetical protein